MEASCLTLKSDESWPRSSVGIVRSFDKIKGQIDKRVAKIEDRIDKRGVKRS
jgi:hypothetical protein